MPGTVTTSDRIALAAAQLWVTKQSATYASPTVSDQAFDCSYFVWLAIKRVNPVFERESSGQIATDTSRFQPVVGPAQAGDIVYFPAGPVPHEIQKGVKHAFPAHVAIMVSASQFIGMQSGGVGKVNIPDQWWWPRRKQFFRYIGPVQ
jgi:cell wall-associated NlpC family hydrolase